MNIQKKEQVEVQKTNKIANPYDTPFMRDYLAREERSKTTTTREIGKIGVDSGTMMFCDPCYVLQNPKVQEDWMDFVDNKMSFIFKEFRNADVVQLNEVDEFAHGAIMTTGFGDGCYSVEIEEGDFGNWGTRVVSAKITFIDQEEIDRFERLLKKEVA